MREGVLAKMENQRPGKNPKKLLIEEKSMAIGWRQEKISNSEIGRHLGCGVDAKHRVFLGRIFTIRKSHCGALDSKARQTKS